MTNHELRVLTVIDNLPRTLLAGDPEVALPETARLAAQMTDWLGFKMLMQENPHLFSEIPKPTGEEEASTYIQRVWPLLQSGERAAALEMGLQQMVTLENVAQVGIQVRIWRAYESGEWQDSPECPDTFRAWVFHILTDTLDGNKATASHLANVVEAVAFLRDIQDDWLPEDLEECFRRPAYRRYRAVAGKILARKKLLEELSGKMRDAAKNELQELSQEAQEIEKQIHVLSEAAVDPENTTQDLDTAGRQRPGLPPILAEEQPGRDATGRYLVSLTLSPAQRTLFQQRTKGIVDYRLSGEVYNTPAWKYAEYRMNSAGKWQRRFHDESGWPDKWETWAESTPVGVFDQVSYVSPELTVVKYWVEVEDVAQS